MLPPYITEEWTDAERRILAKFFTNLDGPVFALVNLPEVVKGALFARYSRSHKSLRRLFLDEFAGELEFEGDHTAATLAVALQRAEGLYQTVFQDFGDDSIAQLGGVHLACEQASNLLTKVLEWGRLMAYLEQSTRYISYATPRSDGTFRYFRDPTIIGSNGGPAYCAGMDSMFETYKRLLEPMIAYFQTKHPRAAGVAESVYRSSIRAKAYDTLRGLLPAASLSNLGIYGTAQSYELLLIRMRVHPLPEVRDYSDLMLTELRKVVPSFMARVDRPDRGGAWSAYMAENTAAMYDLATNLFGQVQPDSSSEVRLTHFDPDAEIHLVTAMLYPYSNLPEEQIERLVRDMSAVERLGIMRVYIGSRHNRRNKPGRGLERVNYRFDVLSDYGAFRDLQRHRMLTIEWQDLTPEHGFEVPEDVSEAGFEAEYRSCLHRSADLYEVLLAQFGPKRASYAVGLAYRLRYVMQFNAREAIHLLELRTGEQAHPNYRRICFRMFELIRDVAKHQALTEAMIFMGGKASGGLERLVAETRAAERRRGITNP